MNLPLGAVGPLSATILGGCFGFVLQRAGLGDGCKLTGQLRLEDWTVFHVMFTAIVVAAAGLWVLDATGYMVASSTFVPAADLWPALAGGALVGLGMSIGGYCPGTSVVAAASGRVDGAIFFFGLIAGTLIFAGTFDWLGSWLESTSPLPIATLPELLHIPGWVVILLLALLALLAALVRHIVTSAPRKVPTAESLQTLETVRKEA